MEVEQWPVSAVTPYERNARKIPQKAIDKVKLSLREYGWQQPLVCDPDGVLIVGHTRLAAAKQLGMAEVPVHVAHNLSAEQIKAYRLMDNRSHQESDWDFDILSEELASIDPAALDLSLTGFDDDELTRILDGGSDVATNDPDADAPEAPLDPVSSVGDTWLLESPTHQLIHVLTCGDASDADVVDEVMGVGDQPLLMVTDPPYGVEYDASWRNQAFGDGQRSTGVVENDDRADWREVWALFPGDVAYVWHGGLHGGNVQDSLHAAGFKVRAQIIWAKQHFAVGRGHYHWQHEPLYYAVKQNGTGHWNGGRKQTTIWEISNRSSFGGESEDASTIHSTQKPLECMARPIRNHLIRGGTVYDPFMGSGTTLIAAENLGRRCLGCELNPAYVDVAVERWQRFSGGVAKRASDGVTFDALRREKTPPAASTGGEEE